MISGEYPCCNGILLLTFPEEMELPKYVKTNCEHCNEVVWHKISRIDPESWTENDFLKKFEIDEFSKIIKDK